MTYDIGIIMVSYNNILKECLPSVKRAMEASSLRIGFVLVDNGSQTFAPYVHVREHLPGAIVLLREKNYGFGHSCNRALQEIEAAYYLFLNPDTVLLDEDFFDRLYAFMKERPWAGILAPRIQHFSGELQETCRRFPAWYMPLIQRTFLARLGFGARYAHHFLMRNIAHDHVRLVDWVQGSAMFISGELCKELQGFDERYWMYFEDVDLCRRAWEKHRPVYYHPDIRIQHAHGKASATPGGYIRNLLWNRAFRAHVVSWIKYVWKWRHHARYSLFVR